MAGILYLVSTPIGNLEDITLRALRILKEVDLIACEDTRHTQKLLFYYQISKLLVSYHEHNEHEQALKLIAKIENGASIALVSDAGTPLLSDPGFRIVQEAVRRDIRVVPIPGPVALITALSASGLPTNQFTFIGFLPAKRAARRARLSELSPLQSTLIFYEAPHRIKNMLEDAYVVLGNRQCVIARELTKLHEEFLRGPLSEIVARFREDIVRGELVVLVGPPLDKSEIQDDTKLIARSILEEIEEAMRVEGLDQKTALKRVARSRGISKSEAYRLMTQEKQWASGNNPGEAKD
jgi:16S rRNA (cytidine1402-2'-O)-methyltransferase